MVQNNDEIDLIFLYRKFKEVVKRGLVNCFRVFNYTLRNWKIVAPLLIIGIGYGVYKDLTASPPKKAELITRVNFDSVDYVYKAIELLNSKIKDQDKAFLSNIGFRRDSLELKRIEVTPYVSINDILNKYDAEDRRWEAVLRNLDLRELFDDTESLIDKTFAAEYKYHNLRLYLSGSATEKTLDVIVNYLNSNEFLTEIKVVAVKNIEDHIENNTKMIEQIDRLLDTYYTGESLLSPAKEVFVVDKNFSVSNLLTQKIELNQEIENLKKELIFSKDIAVVINNPRLTNEDKGITSTKAIFYPVVFLLLFLLVSFVKHSYLYLRELDKNS